MKTKQSAFTLIELMIVVSILGILTAISYPSYQAYIKKSKQAEAQATLVSFASAMEQFYLDKNSYVGATGTKAAPDAAGTVDGIPWIFSSKVPIDSGTKTYDLTVTAATTNSFTLKATPVDSSFNTYSLDNLGTKTAICNTVAQAGWC